MTKALAITTAPQYALIAVPAILLPFATIIVALKLRSRRRRAVGYWYDDWTLVGSLVSAYALYIFICISVVYGGLGVSLSVLGFEDDGRIKIFTQTASVACRIFWATAAVFIQLSLLSLNLRLFAPRGSRSRTVSFLFIGLCIAWWLMFFIGTLTQCVPLSTLWDQDASGKCINDQEWYSGTGFSHTILNLLILALFLRQTLTTRGSSSQKTSLYTFLALGLTATLFSLLRISVLVNAFYVPSSNFTLSPSLSILFGIIELTLAITTASLLTFHPTFAQIQSVQSPPSRSSYIHARSTSRLGRTSSDPKSHWYGQPKHRAASKSTERGRSATRGGISKLPAHVGVVALKGTERDLERARITTEARYSRADPDGDVTLDDIMLSGGIRVTSTWAVQSERESVAASEGRPALP